MDNSKLILKVYKGLAHKVPNPTVTNLATAWFGNLAWIGWRYAISGIEETTRDILTRDEALHCLEVLVAEVTRHPEIRLAGIRSYKEDRLDWALESYVTGKAQGMRQPGLPLTPALEEELINEGETVLAWLVEWLPGRRLRPIERLVDELRKVICYFDTTNGQLCTFSMSIKELQQFIYQPLYARFTANLMREDPEIHRKQYDILETFLTELNWRRPLYWERRKDQSPLINSTDFTRIETHGFGPRTMLAESPHLNFCTPIGESLFEDRQATFYLGKEAFARSFFHRLSNHFLVKELVAWDTLKVLAKLIKATLPPTPENLAPMTREQSIALDRLIDPYGIGSGIVTYLDAPKEDMVSPRVTFQESQAAATILEDQDAINTQSATPSATPKYTIRQVALIHIFKGLIIEKKEADEIIKPFGHTSGERLYKLHNEFFKTSNRIGVDGDRVQPLINDIEAILDSLTGSYRDQAESELKTLKAKLGD